MTAPLIVTADPALRDELLRLAAAAGVVPDLATDAATALRCWARAPVVLVGSDAAPALARLGPVRRDGVHVLAPDGAGGDLYPDALALGALSVTGLPGSQAWVVDTLSDLGDAARAPGVVVGVIGGSGGAGATTLACGLGQAAARSGPAAVIDCDPLGPGVDRMLGLEGRDGSRWEGLCQTTGRISAAALRGALPRRDGLGALSWRVGSTATLQPFAVREAIAAARRGHDVVVLDLARAGGPLTEELVARCDLLVVVVVPTLVGIASAARLAARLPDPGHAVAVLRGSGIDEREAASASRLRVLARMSDQRGLAEAIDLGLGPLRSMRGPLGRTCRAVLEHAGASSRSAAESAAA